MSSISEVKALIFWEGFPACGLLTKRVLDEFPDTKIIATRANVPFSGLEGILQHPIIWLDNPNDIWKLREEYSDRNFIIHTGWSHKGWLAYDKLQKKSVNAKIVIAVDNSYRGDWRQYVGAIWFRLYLKKFFDGAFVPGKSATKLMKFLGMPANRIFSSNYGAFEHIYQETTSILERPREFLFIGQLIERKGLDVLLKAFNEYRREGGTWRLRIAGSGEWEPECQGNGIELQGFVQPHKAATLMNQARVLIAPSKHDNWGTVLAEAAACGMHIISTPETGASWDIIKDDVNGVILNELTVAKLTKVLFKYEKASPEYYVAGSAYSKKVAKQFNSISYYKTFLKMVKEL